MESGDTCKADLILDKQSLVKILVKLGGSLGKNNHYNKGISFTQRETRNEGFWLMDLL